MQVCQEARQKISSISMDSTRWMLSRGASAQRFGYQNPSPRGPVCTGAMRAKVPLLGRPRSCPEDSCSTCSCLSRQHLPNASVAVESWPQHGRRSTHDEACKVIVLASSTKHQFTSIAPATCRSRSDSIPYWTAESVLIGCRV